MFLKKKYINTQSHKIFDLIGCQAIVNNYVCLFINNSARVKNAHDWNPLCFILKKSALPAKYVGKYIYGYIMYLSSVKSQISMLCTDYTL